MGLKFNGIEKTYLTVLHGSNNQPWAPVSRVYHAVPGRAGSYMQRKRITGNRELAIPVSIKGRDKYELEQIKEDMARWLIHDEAKPLILPREPDRTYYAAVDGSFDPEEMVEMGQGTIPFVCSDPFKYGQEVTANTGKVTNIGSVEVNPVFSIRFTGTVKNFTLTNQQGKAIKIIWNFVQNDLLVIDAAARKITINGLLKMTALDLSSNWFNLLPGENTITATGPANTTITFRPRWL